MMRLITGLLALCLCVSCSQTIAPRLVPNSTPMPVSLEREGHLFRADNPTGRVINFLAFLQVQEPREYHVAVFSVSPEQLAALLIATAPHQGWRVQEEALHIWPHSWTVSLQQPHAHLVMIEAGDRGHGSQIKVGHGDAYLPPALFPPLRAAVLAYLQGP